MVPPEKVATCLLSITFLRVATYKVSKAMAESFADKTGGTVCKELKGIETGKVLCSCPDCIRAGVEVVEEILKL